MLVPYKILKKMTDMKAKRLQIDIANRLREDERKRANKEVDDLRILRKDELLKCAGQVTNWLEDFFSSRDGRKFFKLVSSINVFCATFWQGQPVPESFMTTFARIRIDRSGKVFYTETYKWMPTHQYLLGKIPIKPDVLIEDLHPEYLTQLAKSIESGSVWDYIESHMPNENY